MTYMTSHSQEHLLANQSYQASLTHGEKLFATLSRQAFTCIHGRAIAQAVRPWAQSPVTSCYARAWRIILNISLFSPANHNSAIARYSFITSIQPPRYAIALTRQVIIISSI
jgi:hypothetical protein